MLRYYTVLIGLGFFLFGWMGLLSKFVASGHLFGIIRVNFEHNIIHLASGILGVLCGLYSSYASKAFLISVGVIYGLLAAIGLIQQEEMVLGMFAVNQTANWIHAIIALMTLIPGICSKRSNHAP